MTPQRRSQETPRRVSALKTKGINTSSKAAAALISPDKPLTEKQKAFVKAWASGETLPAAAQRAGYNEGDDGYCYRLARQPNVLRAYQLEKVAFEKAGEMTRKKVMDGLLDAAQMAKLMAEPSSMVAAWREIGRMCGYYEPVRQKIDVNISGDVTVRKLTALSDEELLKIIKQGETPDDA